MAAHRLPTLSRSALLARSRRLHGIAARLKAECNEHVCTNIRLIARLNKTLAELADTQRQLKQAKAEAGINHRLLLAARAELANRDAVSVASWIRLVDDPVDVPTQPTNVTSLQQRGPHAA